MNKQSKLAFLLLIPTLVLSYSKLAVAETDPPLGEKELEHFYLMQSEGNLEELQPARDGDFDYIYCRFKKNDGGQTWAFGLQSNNAYVNNIKGEWIYSSYYGTYSFITTNTGKSILNACENARKYYGYKELLFLTAYEQVSQYYPLFVRMDDGQLLRISPDLLR